MAFLFGVRGDYYGMLIAAGRPKSNERPYLAQFWKFGMSSRLAYHQQSYSRHSIVDVDLG